MIYYACDIPEDLYYDIERDVWARFEGDLAVLGMTDVAQTRCGKFAAISFRDVGRTIMQGKALATIESAKWVGPFPAPFSGKVVEVNQAGFDVNLLLANKDPYGAGWLVKLQPLNLSQARDRLVTGREAVERYKQRIDELHVNCLRCLD